MKKKSGQDESLTWGRRIYGLCLLGMMGLVVLGMEMAAGLVPAVYASGPGGNVADPNVRAVDIAKPAVLRLFTTLAGQLTVTFNTGPVTFPLTPQQGVNGYPLTLSGSGAFISAHGDILTADHVVRPAQDAKKDVDASLDQLAAQDVANYINNHSTQRVSADQVAQGLASGQLPSTTSYQTIQQLACLSTEFSGQITATSFQNLGPNQCSAIDKVKANSPTDQNDIAIVHVTGMDNMPMLTLGDSSTVHEQDQLTVIGFPGNGDVGTDPNTLLTPSVNTVSVSSLKNNANGQPLIQIDGNVGHGDSGGPAVDMNGKIVGIVSFGISDNQTSTSFLRASNSAQTLIQSAGIDTTPSALQRAWSQAINDYAATAPGHWHTSAHEFQQILTQYLLFKAVAPYQQYAQQQAQSEKPVTPTTSSTGTGTGSAVASGLGGLNLTYVLIGGLVLLVVLLSLVSIILLVRSSRHKALAKRGAPVSSGPVPGYGSQTAAAVPPQQYGQFPASPTVPRTPPYAGQAGYSQPPLPQTPPPRGPQPPLTQRSPNGMNAFGAPPARGSAQPGAQDFDDSTVINPAGGAAGQWRIWPCGHSNRPDARFCAVCGEPVPRQPLVRRFEQ